MSQAAKLDEEARAFDRQILERVANGHLPDLRRSGRCEYFYNNVWRDQAFAGLYFGEVVERTLSACRAHLPGRGRVRLLEVGCGPGHVSLELSRNGLDVTGLDVSETCIGIARKVAAEDPWRNERGPLRHEVSDLFMHRGSYDAVLFVASLHHFGDCRRVVRHVRSLLTPGGLLVADEPTRDRVSRRNVAVLMLMRQILSASGAYYRKLDLPLDEAALQQDLAALLREERYETEDGAKVQSVHDNESGYAEMLPALREAFEELELREDYAFFHQLVGGVRLADADSERRLAGFLKLIDTELCRQNAIDPTNFFFVGRLR